MGKVKVGDTVGGVTEMTATFDTVFESEVHFATITATTGDGREVRAFISIDAEGTIKVEDPNKLRGGRVTRHVLTKRKDGRHGHP